MPPRQFPNIQTVSGRVLTVFGLGTLPFCSAGVLGQVDVYPVGDGPRAVVAADFNGDGWMDIATANRNENNGASVLLNQGDGTFAEAVNYSFDSPGLSIAATDFDGDRDLDLVVGGAHRVFFLANDGAGQFSVSQILEVGNKVIEVVPGDLDGDGDTDLAFSTRHYNMNYSDYDTVKIKWAMNDGHMNFIGQGTLDTFTTSGPTSLVIGDLDDDGDLDLVAVENDWTYTTSSKYISGVAWSDFHLLYNNGTGSEWQSHEMRFPEEFYCFRPTFTDLDGDSDLDLVFLRQGPAIMRIDMLENLGEGEFQWTPIDWEFGNYQWYWEQSFAFADLATDGDIDVVYARTWSSRLELHLAENQDHQGFDGHELIHDENVDYPTDVTTADVDGDGKREVIVTTTQPSGALLVFHTDIEFTGPRLHQTALVRGETAEFQVRDAVPFEAVFFLYSLQGSENQLGHPQLGGLVLDLNDPIVLFGATISDENGIAEYETRIPNNVPLLTVTTQAVMRRGTGNEESVKTNFVTRVIQD